MIGYILLGMAIAFAIKAIELGFKYDKLDNFSVYNAVFCFIVFLLLICVPN